MIIDEIYELLVEAAQNRCVCCGAIIPEGEQVCYLCEGSTKR